MDSSDLGEIRELSLLKDLEDIAARYERDYGAPPLNLSTWDPSKELGARKLLGPVSLSQPLRVDYSFTYTAPRKLKLLSKLGFQSDNRDCLLSHSGSSAIVAMINWLRINGRKRLLIVGPRYFTVPHACAALGVTCSITHFRRVHGSYTLPSDFASVARRFDAVWVTNPVYCTSADIAAEDLRVLSGIAVEGPILILDECLAEDGRQIGPQMQKAGGEIFSIHAPHKAICVNGLKFAALTYDPKWASQFDSWSDVWLGCLPASSELAIEHYLSPNFEVYADSFKAECRQAFAALADIVQRYPGIELDTQASGYLVSVIGPHEVVRVQC